MEGLPSWAVDWSNELTPWTGSLFSAGGRRRFYISNPPEEYLHSDELLVPGYILGEIQVVTPCCRAAQDGKDDFEQSAMLRDWLQSVEHLLLASNTEPEADKEGVGQSPIQRIYGVERETQISALGSTLVEDYDGYRTSRFGSFAHQAYISTRLGYIPPELAVGDFLTPSSIGDFMKFDWHTNYASTLKVQEMRGRRPFRLSNGYIGNGPCEATVGDVIVILESLEVPCLLRRVERSASFVPGSSSYQYLGVAYVHGVMDGEFLGRKPKQELMILI
jgi:hypothetical protein